MESTNRVEQLTEDRTSAEPHWFWSGIKQLKTPLMVVAVIGLLVCVIVAVVMAVISPSTIFPSDIHFITTSSSKEQHTRTYNHYDHSLQSNDTFEEQRRANIKKKDSKRLSTFKEQDTRSKPYTICNTKICVLAASAIIEAMDETTNPCDDFYQFACGGWVKKNPVPKSLPVWGQFEVLDHKVKTALSTILTSPTCKTDPKPLRQVKFLYNACMNISQLESLGVTPLTDFLQQYGGWPMTLETWNESAFDWHFAVAEAKVKMGRDFFVSMWVSADLKNTSTTSIYIDQASLGMPQAMLINSREYKKRINSYKKYMARTASILAASKDHHLEESVVKAEVSATIDFEIALANISTPEEDRRDSELLYNKMTLSDLNTLTSETPIDWVKLLRTVFTYVNITIDKNTTVFVMEIEYMKKLASLINSTTSRTIANYVMWRHVQDFGDETNEAMRDASFQYNKVASGVTLRTPQHETCINKANEYMGDALGVKYVEYFFSQQTMADISIMVEDIREAFKESLASKSWMDEVTKLKAIDKADSIVQLVGYPEWYGNDTELESYYDELGELFEDQHFMNIKTIWFWSSTNELSEFGLPTDRYGWSTSPATANAVYISEFNTVTLPAAILQPPFYRPNSLQALNYGAIGQVIGHEITHAFDDEGRYYDEEGNMIPWWSNSTLVSFMHKIQCIVNQYGYISIPDLGDLSPNATINGVNTQGENIADNGGLRHAYLAYLGYVDNNGEESRLPGIEYFTPYQLFFLSAANSWCSSITREDLVNQILTDYHVPNRYRVLGSMKNMEQFSSVWNCSPVSPMNPPKKCVVW